MLNNRFLKENMQHKRKVKKIFRYLTRRGSFMDPIDRIDHKKFPPATIYDLEFQWPKTHPDNPRKQIATKRNTYMD